MLLLQTGSLNGESGIYGEYFLLFFRRFSVLLSYVGFVLLVCPLEGRIKPTKKMCCSPSISSDLKIPPNSIYLCRLSLFQRMKESLHKPGLQTVILVGAGGSGKTTLARSYAKQSGLSLVWEINAFSCKSLLNSFHELAFELATSPQDQASLSFIQQIQHEDERTRQMMIFVRSKLRFQQNWLLIFDNVESWAEIRNYLPYDASSWGEGKVILTTQDHNHVYASHPHNTSVIEMDMLNEEESYELFKKIRGEENSQTEKETRVFLSWLPSFPLDVAMAAYYLKDTATNFDDYINRINQGDNYLDAMQELLLKENTYYNQTRYRLIQLAFQRIVENNPEFKTLLWVVCHVDSQHIPKKLLECLIEPVGVAHFIKTLHHYSFITEEHEKGDKSPEDTFSMHRSVQEFGRSYLWQSDEDKTALLDRVWKAIHSFYVSQLDKPFTLRVIIPHLESVLKTLSMHVLPQSYKDIYTQNLLLTLGWVHKKSLRKPLLERQYFSQAYHLQMHTHYFDDATEAKLLQDLASVCADLEYADEALMCAQESIRLWQLLPEHEASLAEVWRLLGYSYIYKNDFQKANACCEKALQTIEGVDQSKLVVELKARIYAIWAWIYSVTYISGEKTHKAKELIHKALQVVGEDKVVSEEQRRSLAEMSPEVARHKVGLGDVYCRSGDYEQAMRQGFGDALYIIHHPTYKHTHGLMHAYISIGVGEVYLRTGRLREAQDCLENAVKDIERMCGQRNSLSLSPHIFCAETCVRLGNVDKAYEHCLAAFSTDKKDNTHYSNLMRHLAYYHAGVIQYKKGNTEKAVEYLSAFITSMKDFCFCFFEPTAYRSLQDHFHLMEEAENQIEAIRSYLSQSSIILQAIYGESHTFIQDYVMPNNKI